MEERQQQERPLVSGGPVFEAGPGWGQKIKDRLAKNFYREILPIIVVIALVFAGQFFGIGRNGQESVGQKETNLAPEGISEIIQPSDSKTLLARRALSQYLEANPGEQLTAGQRVFIETLLRNKVDRTFLRVGDVIRFLLNDVRDAVVKAKQLTKFQLEKWEELARRVRF